MPVRYAEVKRKEISGFTCNRCGDSHDRGTFEFQEMLFWHHHCGYCSIFGDTNRASLALCQTCTKELLGEFVIVEERL